MCKKHGEFTSISFGPAFIVIWTRDSHMQTYTGIGAFCFNNCFGGNGIKAERTAANEGINARKV